MGSMEILDRIESGEVSVQEGISLIGKCRDSQDVPVKKGSFMRISVLDKDSKFSFTIPLFVINAGLSLTRFAASCTPKDHMDDNAKKALDVIKSLDKRDIKRLVNELRKCKTINFIEVHSKDSHVSISIV